MSKVEFSHNLYGRRFFMKGSKFSDSQILSILKQAEAGQAVPDLCRFNRVYENRHAQRLNLYLSNLLTYVFDELIY